MTSFVVSDIHDHYSLLIAALNKNGFDINNQNHRLIVCGDAFYSGPEPGELYSFMLKLKEENRLIFIYGNHDIELLDNLNKQEFKRKGNRKCIELLVEYMTNKTGLTDDELILESEKIGFTSFLSTVPRWYYETDNYIFTHGFIPTKSHTYYQDWRSSNEDAWRCATVSDAMRLSMLYGISEPGKVIVCGHYSAARCYLMKSATKEDWDNKIYKDVSKVPLEGFKTFISDTFIDLDQSVKKTGFINCLVLNE